MERALRGGGALTPGTVLARGWGARGDFVFDPAPSGTCTELGEFGVARLGLPGLLWPGAGEPVVVALWSLLLAVRGWDRRGWVLAPEAALAQGRGTYRDCFSVRVLLDAVGAWGAEWSCHLCPEQAK